MLTLPDKVLIATLLALSLSSFLLIAALSPEGGTVVVEQDGRLVRELSLDDEAILKVKGPLGVTTVTVKGGEARILSSPCPQKLCVKMGAISQAGEMVVCVPNKVVVRITGEEKVDAVTR